MKRIAFSGLSFQAKAHFDASANDGKRSFKTRIDQDVAVGGCDQVGGKPLGTDVVKIIGDAVRWKGFIPVALGYESARCD